MIDASKKTSKKLPKTFTETSNKNNQPLENINAKVSEILNDRDILASFLLSPITFYNNLITLRDTGKEFELQGDLLKTITNENYNIDLANLSDKKRMYEFAKEMHFDVKAPGNKYTRNTLLIKLLKSPAIMGSGNTTKSFII